MNESNSMSNKSQAVNEDLSSLAEDARALMSATSEVAGEKVAEARKRLAAALENSKQIYGRLREKAIDGAKAADEVVRENPYQAMGIALAAGAIVGFLLARSCSRED